MKLTYEQKLKGYNEWKTGLKSPGIIARELSVKRLSVIYFLRLADKHGVEVLKHGKNKYYSPEEKLRIINRVLIDNESILSVSVDEGLSSSGLLNSWINSYIKIVFCREDLINALFMLFMAHHFSVSHSFWRI